MKISVQKAKIVYNLNSVGFLEIEFVAPIPEQLHNTAILHISILERMHKNTASRSRLFLVYKMLNTVFLSFLATIFTPVSSNFQAKGYQVVHKYI